MVKCDCGFDAKFIEMSREPVDHFPVRDPDEVISIAELLATPNPVSEDWHFTCDNCGLSSPFYHLPLSRTSDERQALSWMLHLMGKTWFPFSAVSWERAMEALFPGVGDAA